MTTNILNSATSANPPLTGILTAVFVALIVVLIVISGFTSMTEAAFMSVNHIRIDELTDSENPKLKKKAKKTLALIKNPNYVLATIQVLNTLIAFINGIIGSKLSQDALIRIFKVNVNSNNYVLYSVLVTIGLTVFLLYFQIIFGELVAKRIGMKWSEKISLNCTPVIRSLMFILFPFVWLLMVSTTFFARIFGVKKGDEIKEVTEDDIILMASNATESGEIDVEENKLIENIFEFDDTKVSEIMTHRTEIDAIEITATYSEILTKINESQYTRYPVYKDTIDNIIGTIHIKDILKYAIEPSEFNLGKSVRKPFFVSSTSKINDIFVHMKKNKVHIAVVLDEYGGVAGLLTIEDLIEEIVGEINDEFDSPEAEFKEINSTTFEVDGFFELDILSEKLDIEFEAESNTVNGFITEQIGHLPKVGEKICVTYKNFEFRPLYIEKNVIKRVLIKKVLNLDEQNS